MKQATIVDIARRLQISPSTVSRALSGHPDIKEETKELVRQVAKELRYTPNPIAQSLKSSRTNTIGVIVPEFTHDFFPSAISGIEEMSYRAGYRILLCQSNENYAREVENTNLLMHHRVAGVIASISQSTKSSEHFRDLLHRKIPLVFFDRVCEDVVTSKVVLDDAACAFKAVSFLIDKGYKRIAHFAGPKDLAICKRRFTGYCNALTQAQRPVLDELIVYGGLHEKDGYHSMNEILHLSQPPDAIFCINDPVALGAYQRIKEAGLRIPEDFALVGASNDKITAMIDPPLTTIDQPAFEMGRRAAELLIDAIEGRITQPETVILDAELIVRKST
jgi:DNA-binding LacI/PurR family transcriptional regulator